MEIFGRNFFVRRFPVDDRNFFPVRIAGGKFFLQRQVAFGGDTF